MKKIGITEIQKIETHMLSIVAKICEENSISYYLRAGSLLGAIRHNGPIPWDLDIDIEVPIDQYKYLYEIFKKSLPDHLKVYWYEEPNYPLLFMRIGVYNFDYDAIHIDIFPMIGLSNNKKTNRRILREFLILQWLYKIKNFNFSQIFNKRKRFFPILFILKTLLYLVPNKLIEKHTEKKLFKFNFSQSSLVVNPFSRYMENSIFHKSYYEPAIYWDYANLKVSIPNNPEKILKQLYDNYMEFPSQNKINKLKKTSVYIDGELYNHINSLIHT